jgi:uncharacterized protein involved in exopolysaccharide biosynthesis
MEEYEVSVGDLFAVLWKEKWIVIVTFGVAVAAALAISYSLPKRYQVETALLIFPPLAQEVGGQVAGTVYSPDTYKRLALGGDLLQDVIAKTFPNGGGPRVADLQSQMKVEVEQATAKDFPEKFPLYLRVTFYGSDPQSLPRLAGAWADGFKVKNADLFLNQSLTYVSQSLAEVERELLEREESLTRYQRENLEPVLAAEVTVLTDLYRGCLSALSAKSQELASAEARLGSLQAALAQEPQFFTLVRAPSDDAIWEFLAARPSPRDLAAYTGLVLEDQVLNSTYVSLRDQVATAEAELEALRAEVAYIQAKVAEAQALVQDKQARLVEVRAEIQRLEREVAVLRDTYTRLAGKLQEARIAVAETAEPIRVVEAPITPTRPIGPNKRMNVAVAGVLGLFVGVLLAFLAHSIETTQERRRDKHEPSQPPHRTDTDQPTHQPGGHDQPNPQG